MHAIRVLAAVLIAAASHAAHAASVFVQNQGDVTQNPVLALDSGPGFSLSADLLAGFFQIFADASPSVSVNNNFSGTFNPVEFVNNTGATVFLSAGAIHASVHASFFDGPASGGAEFATIMRTSGSLFVRILGGAGQGDYLASFVQQVRVFYNLDGSIKNFEAQYSPNVTNGMWVSTGIGTGIGGANIHFATPPLRLDPGARLQLSFLIGGDASDSSSVNVFNTLGFEVPAGVTLTNDVGSPLAWVTVPEPDAQALLMAGVAWLGFAVRGRRRSG